MEATNHMHSHIPKAQYYQWLHSRKDPGYNFCWQIYIHLYNTTKYVGRFRARYNAVISESEVKDSQKSYFL